MPPQHRQRHAQGVGRQRPPHHPPVNETVLQTRKVLATVKAYPEISAKHGETVCVAGIDVDTGSWVRLYPIPFRDLEAYRKFKKYSIIEVRGERPKDDNRPESCKIDRDSIKIQEWLDTDNGTWTKRGQYVLPTVSRSLCEIQE